MDLADRLRTTVIPIGVAFFLSSGIGLPNPGGPELQALVTMSTRGVLAAILVSLVAWATWDNLGQLATGLEGAHPVVPFVLPCVGRWRYGS
jgi:hypothetical protein